MLVQGRGGGHNPIQPWRMASLACNVLEEKHWNICQYIKMEKFYIKLWGPFEKRGDLETLSFHSYLTAVAVTVWFLVRVSSLWVFLGLHSLHQRLPANTGLGWVPAGLPPLSPVCVPLTDFIRGQNCTLPSDWLDLVLGLSTYSLPVAGLSLPAVIN